MFAAAICTIGSRIIVSPVLINISSAVFVGFVLSRERGCNDMRDINETKNKVTVKNNDARKERLKFAPFMSLVPQHNH
tara:strand:+ start:5816 stop:6049 length:234 start_codon:yes stop_codon:yes gene_type:complete